MDDHCREGFVKISARLNCSGESSSCNLKINVNESLPSQRLRLEYRAGHAAEASINENIDL